MSRISPSWPNSPTSLANTVAWSAFRGSGALFNFVCAYPLALSRMLRQFLSGGFPGSVLARISVADSGIPALAVFATDADDWGHAKEDVVAMQNT